MQRTFHIRLSMQGDVQVTDTPKYNHQDLEVITQQARDMRGVGRNISEC